MELKLSEEYDRTRTDETRNRTILELKRENLAQLAFGGHARNRTILELKLGNSNAMLVMVPGS